MKKRSGFVSNSSSSSFLIKLDPTNMTDLINVVRAYSSCKSWEKSLFHAKHFFGLNSDLKTGLKTSIGILDISINEKKNVIDSIEKFEKFNKDSIEKQKQTTMSKIKQMNNGEIAHLEIELKALKEILEKIEKHKDSDLMVIVTDDLNFGLLRKEDYEILHEETN